MIPTSVGIFYLGMFAELFFDPSTALRMLRTYSKDPSTSLRVKKKTGVVETAPGKV